MNISHNLETILPNLQGQVLVAATKYVGVDEIRELVSLGIYDIGENRVQDFLSKSSLLKDEPIIWHFIGHLQTNKVKLVINQIDCLHSLDRWSLVEVIQKERTTPLDCFVEVNISNESSKTGMNINEVIDFIKKCQSYDKIHIVGLMGMASNSKNEGTINAEFMQLYHLQQSIQSLHLQNVTLPFLSMGMSSDYLIAIACHATHLRLGKILFRNEEF